MSEGRGRTHRRDQGNTEHEWTTLFNRGRDVGATLIHGIAACDVVDAPRFADIADHLLSMLYGRVVVAHNATFDMRFLLSSWHWVRYAIIISCSPMALVHEMGTACNWHLPNSRIVA